jgi:inner membrane transporter RhtA
MSRTLLAVLAVLVAMVSFQTGASLAKQLFPLVGPVGTTTLRLVFGALILCTIWRPWRQKLTRAELRTIVIYGVAMGGMNLCFYIALKTVPLGIGVAVEFTGPLAVAVIASRRAIDFVWAALAAAGIIFILPIFRASAPVDLHGILWALFAGACWGAYILLGQRAAASVHGGTVTALGMAAGALCVLPFGVAVVGKPLLNPAILPIGIGVAILSGAFPYSLEMFGLQRLPAHTFGVLMSVEPALGAVIGRILLHEKLALLQIVAIACVIAASAGSTLSSRRAAPVSDVAYDHDAVCTTTAVP